MPPPAVGRCRLGRAPLRAQLPEQLHRETCVNGEGSPVHAVLDGGHLARRHERGPGVEQDDVPPRPGLPAQHALDERRVRAGIGAAQRRRLRPAQPDGLGIHLASLDALLGHVVDDTRAVEGELVDAGAADHEGPLRAQAPQDLRHLGRDGRVPHPDQTAGRPRRVRERAQQVERRPHADLPARRAGVAHGRVERRREQEREAQLRHRASGRGRVVVDPDAKRVEHVRRARSRGDRAVAVLGHRHPQRGHDQGRRRGDVEGPGAVAAGAARCRSSPRVPPPGPRAHASRTRSRPARPPSRRASAGP